METATEREPAQGLTVVIPALNEERGLPVTLAALKETAEAMDGPVEIIVVDDGSTDRTAEIAVEAGARVVSHPVSIGYGAALKSGIRAASHERVAITDADGTYPVEELRTMAPLLDRFDMVVGARTGKHYRRRALLSPMRTVFLLLVWFVAGARIPDPNSGLRVFRRARALELLDALPRSFSFTTTITLIMTLHGRFVRYHPIAYRPRLGKRKVRLFRDALRAMQSVTEVILRHNPLKVFLLLGLVPLLLSLVVLLAGEPSGVGGIAASVLFSTGILVFAVGMGSVARLHRRLGRALGDERDDGPDEPS